MFVTSLLCGPWADLWPFYGFLYKRFSVYIKVYQRWALQRSGPTDPPRKTAVNSLQLFQSPPNSAWVTHDSSPFHSLSCFKTPLHQERIKGRKSVQTFLSEAIDRTLAWIPHDHWKIATRPETQITHSRGGRQSLAPIDINTRERKPREQETVSHAKCE